MDKFVFPNGFEDWHETHFEIVTAINEELTRYDEDPYRENIVSARMIEQGTGGMYLLAAELTNEFEAKYVGIPWGQDGGRDYHETLEEFLSEKFKLSE